MGRRSRACLWVASLLLAAGGARAQLFTGLGTVQGTSSSSAFGVSADGSVVVGVSGTPSAAGLVVELGLPFRWTQSGGMQGLGLVAGAISSTCRAVSGDGATIVGGMIGATYLAYRWNNGFETLGALGPDGTSEAFGVSHDGSVVVGMSSVVGNIAFRWTESGGMQSIGVLPGGAFSAAQGVSEDGEVVVGYGDSTETTSEPYLGKDQAFRWTAGGGMIGLGDLPGGAFNSRAFGVSSDGQVAVGESDSAAGTDAIRYTEAGGIESLGDFDGTAHAASADGSVIVGEGYFGNPPHLNEAFVWDATHGVRRLATVLTDDLHLSLSTWYLGPAQAVSADGNTIVGWGVDPAGNTEAWLARLPEPDAPLLQGAALLALAALAGRRAR